MNLLLAAALLAPAAPVRKDTTRDDALKVLVEKAKDGDAKVRAEAVRRMGTLEHPPVVPHVARLLKDDDPYVRLEAVHALTRLGKADEQTVEVFRQLVQDRVNVSLSGGRFAAVGGNAKPFASVFREHVSTAPPYLTAGWVVDGLPDLCEYAQDLAGDLVTILNATDVNKKEGRRVARTVAFCLGKTGKPSAETIAALERWATEKGDDGRVGREAAVALLKLDPKNKTAKGYLTAAAKRASVSDVWPTTLAAVNADGGFTPTLVGLATGEIWCKPGLRLDAIRCLGRTPAAKPEVKKLLPLLDAADLTVREATAAALVRLDPGRTDAILPTLLDLIDKGADAGHDLADPLSLLVERKLNKKEVRQTLFEVLSRAEQPDWRACRIAATLYELDPEDPAVHKWFDDRLGDRDGDKAAVIEALRGLGPKAKRFAPTLLRLLRQDDFTTRGGDGLTPAIRELTK
jgi:HEAT repeat protein